MSYPKYTPPKKITHNSVAALVWTCVVSALFVGCSIYGALNHSTESTPVPDSDVKGPIKSVDSPDGDREDLYPSLSTFCRFFQLLGNGHKLEDVESTLNVPQLDDGSRVEIIGTASTNCGGKLDKLVADLDHVRVLSSGATGYVFDDHLKTQ